MKIRFLQSCSTDGPSYAGGQTYDLPKADADGFISAGLAVAEGGTEVETAVAEQPVETAVATSKRTRNGRK